MRIIDFRLRPPAKGFLATRIYSAPDNRDRYTRRLGFEPAESVRRQSMDLLFQEMDAAGIARGLAVGRNTDKLGVVPNADVAALARDYPQRFLAAGSINPAERKDAMRQIAEARALGINIINLEPGVLAQPMQVDDRRLYPIYAHCEDQRIAVILMTGGAAGPDITYSAPAHLDRVCGDFPDLTIVSAHGGWPWVQEILHVAFRRSNLYLCPDMYLGLQGSADYVKAADTYLADQVLFGTAYPFCPLKPYTDWFLSLPIRADSMEKVLYRNAARVLGLTG